MLKRMLQIASLILLFSPSLARAEEPAAAGSKQPVFLLCPYKEKLSAWSLFLAVDPQNPRKVLALGLEKLKKQNAKDFTYDQVLAAQKNPKTERETIGSLDAKNFSGGMLEVQKDEALKVEVKPLADGSLRLMISLRINLEQRFVVGGNERQKRDVVLRYNQEKRAWEALALALEDKKGKQVASAANPKFISGLAFPVQSGSIGIPTIYGVMAGGVTITLMDNPEIKEQND